VAVELSERDRAVLRGAHGEASALAMRIIVEMAGVMNADRLIDVTRAHIDSCLYHGLAGLDFVERLAAGGARVAVPTTLNVGAVDLLHPEHIRSSSDEADAGRRQMALYAAMGARPTWTCAPYQLEDRPSPGEHVAWAESNAIVFCNSVLGARTNRYGDFIDACAAITGRVPFAGLHRDEERSATIVLRLAAVPTALLESDVLYPTVGLAVGRVVGGAVAAIDGLPTGATEDNLKALGAAAASSGAVAMFHAIGLTPEAPTLDAATGGVPVPIVEIGASDLRAARDELSAASDGRIGAVCLGTPHASLAELERLAALLDGVSVRVPVWVNTGRGVLALAEDRGIASSLRHAGVGIVTDTCTYLAPMIGDVDGPVMTDSAKWAWYGPSNTGVDVVFGSLEECVRSAAEGRVVRDERLWGDARG
jgi:predicted aconitase